MTKNLYRQAKFLLSVAELEQLPPDSGFEVAIVGRSNAGKSSILNEVTQNKNLARVSKTPGRTQHLNVFEIDTKRRLVDLPGYGYARVRIGMRDQWQKNINTYLHERTCLRGVILVMDIRHPFRDLDLQFLSWCDEESLPVHILLNKADKLNKTELGRAIKTAEEVLGQYEHPMSFQPFSALKKTGVKELHEVLNHWFDC